MVERFDINKRRWEKRGKKNTTSGGEIFARSRSDQFQRTMSQFPRFPRNAPVVFPFPILAVFFLPLSGSVYFFLQFSVVKYRGKYVALDLFAVEAAS